MLNHATIVVRAYQNTLPNTPMILLISSSVTIKPCKKRLKQDTCALLITIFRVKRTCHRLILPELDNYRKSLPKAKKEGFGGIQTMKVECTKLRTLGTKILCELSCRWRKPWCLKAATKLTWRSSTKRTLNRSAFFIMMVSLRKMPRSHIFQTRIRSCSSNTAFFVHQLCLKRYPLEFTCSVISPSFSEIDYTVLYDGSFSNSNTLFA